MPVQPPPVELLPPSAAPELPPSPEASVPAKATRRPLLFAGIFLACLSVSLAYVWSRAPVYQSAATLLTVAPAALDQEDIKASVQQVTVQRRILLSVPLLAETLRRLHESLDSEASRQLTADALRAMLAVEPMPETNVVELRARGPQAAVLAPVVNAWIDAYQALREQAVRASKDTTSAALADEFEQLGHKIETKRRALDQFRRAHDILSKNDMNNQAMARLNGLNTALNKASDDEVQAKAKLDAIAAAIARGEPVLPPREEQSLAYLERRAQKLREQVKDLRRRYTPQYVALQPQLRIIPEQLAQTEATIRDRLAQGKRAALSEAEQAHASARQAVQEIRRQIETHKREAAEFTARFAEHEALTGEIEELEKVYRETQARLARVQATPSEKYPPLQVVERAYPPTGALWPDYWRDSGIALAGSLGTALVFLLLHDYLMRRERTGALFKLPDIRVYSVPENLLLRQPRDVSPELVPAAERVQFLEENKTPALENPWPRELSESDLRLLLEAADLGTKPLLGLLLSGLSLHEAAGLRAEQVDLAGNRLWAGEPPRALPLAPRLKTWLTQTQPLPAWSSETAPEVDELVARIACVAADAGLARPESIDAAALRHTYILYLVRQGIRLADLERVVGAMPVKTVAGYARFSPAGPGLPTEAVPLVHPVLRPEDVLHNPDS